jgi:hypothetical protein
VKEANKQARSGHPVEQFLEVFVLLIEGMSLRVGKFRYRVEQLTNPSDISLKAEDIAVPLIQRDLDAGEDHSTIRVIKIIEGIYPVVISDRKEVKALFGSKITQCPRAEGAIGTGRVGVEVPPVPARSPSKHSGF